ncbi:MAG: PEP-utilizing enzyme [Candidatus Atabeyarchaeum deiterrae]|jgi:phosphoenolpyruvate synthase/pyruvate phosphate dikinase
MKKIGEGLSCSSKSEAAGELVYIRTVEDVVNLFDKATGKICIIEDAGTTTLGPILSELAGTVCTTGGAGSHLAIVSREFNIPCIMGTKIKSKDMTSLQGKKGKIVTEDDDRGVLYQLD